MVWSRTSTGSVIIVLVAIAVYQLTFGNRKQYSPIVEVTGGKVQGIISHSRDGRSFFEYLGIPYAYPPIGALRFEPPHPVVKWSGVRDATKYGSMCMQVDNLARVVIGDEDCLFLNVFIPQFLSPNTTSALPVMVYIHGGYFMSGGSTYQRPEYFMDEDIVLVVINYRVNSLGFLNTEDDVVLGNMGLKDQTQALIWVKMNIQKFGGDPTRVTLFGQSAGASSVHYHMLSPLSKGLFNKAILQSGSAIKPWSFVSHPQRQAIRLGRKLNCPFNSTTDLVVCLKGLDAREIVAIHKEAVTTLIHPLQMFGPSVEKGNSSEHKAFLVEHPYEILQSQPSSRVPVIVGVNSGEGLLVTGRIYYDKNLVKSINQNWLSLSPEYLLYDKTNHDLSNTIQSFYFGPTLENDKLNFSRNFINLTNLFTDRLYAFAARETALLHSKLSPVYLYYNDYQGQNSLTYFMDIKGEWPLRLEFLVKFIRDWFNLFVYGWKEPSLGVCHGDEVVLLFKLPLVEVSTTSSDYTMSKKLIKLWTQFAHDESSMIVDQVQWMPLDSNSKNELKYAAFRNDNHFSIIDEPFKDRMKFWKSLNLSWKRN